MPSVSTQDELPTDFPSLRYVRLSWPLSGVAEVGLNRAPVNAMNLELWEELDTTFEYLTGLFPKHTRAMVLSSSLERAVFTAGNDLLELHAPSTTEARFNAFWLASVRALTRLYTLPLTTVVAVDGACPAGGCALALCCDARVVSAGAKMGLNESALGIPVPLYWARLFLSIASHRGRAENALFSGHMLKAAEAEELGLVDRIVHANGDVRSEAFKYANQLAKSTNAVGRAKTKGNIRDEFATEWLAYGEKEARLAWKDLSKAVTSNALGAVLKRLGRSKM